jgi:hypothetical protein
MRFRRAAGRVGSVLGSKRFFCACCPSHDRASAGGASLRWSNEDKKPGFSRCDSFSGKTRIERKNLRGGTLPSVRPIRDLLLAVLIVGVLAWWARGCAASNLYLPIDEDANGDEWFHKVP